MKKGMEMQLALMILAVFGAVILIGVVYYWNTQTEKSFDREMCKISVTSVYLSKAVSIVGSPWLKLKCSTNIKQLEDKEKFKEELINSIVDCWYQYGSGKMDFISNWDFAWGDKNCFVCAVLSSKQRLVFSKEELNPYLPKLENLNFGFNEGGLVVNPNDELYIMYGVAKELKWWELKNLLVVPLFVYKSGSRYSLLILPKEETNKKEYCDIKCVFSGKEIGCS